MTQSQKRFEPVPADEFAARRARFQEQLGEGVAIVPGSGLQTRSNDTEFPFRQDSDLYYLTGWEQPDATAVFCAERYLLFVQPRDPRMETWNGRRPGTEGAVSEFGADEAFPVGEFGERLPDLLADRARLFHSFGRDRTLDDQVVAALGAVRRRARDGVGSPHEIVSPHLLVHDLRLRKTETELAIMRAAAEISYDAHHAAARLARSGAHEYELEAALLHTFRRRGGSGPAYANIVGSGDNATILHYVENRDELRAGALVLIDAGVELHGYASDVTRTYPVDGRFEGVAADVYRVVLDAQLAALDAIHPGVTLKAVHDVAVRELVGGMLELGALEGEADELIESEAFKPFYMHGTGHMLGLDVHDVGQYTVDGKPRTLEAGMCFTVEPGLYFGTREEKTPEHLRGIGVRIEDDVVITESGYENITAAIPKQPEDVEAWMRD